MSRGKSCGAVGFRGKQFLLLKDARSKNWGAPKGHVEAGETEEQTARREVFEESGLANLRFIPKFRKVNRYSLYLHGKSLPVEVVFFLAESTQGEVTLSKEHMEYAWLDFDSALARVRFKTLKLILAEAARIIDPHYKPKNALPS